MKAALAALAALCLGTTGLDPQPYLTIPAPKHFAFTTIPLIQCQRGQGSGVRVSDEMTITAYHVIRDRAPCGSGPVAFEIHHIDPEHDFAILKSKATAGFRATVSCEGINAGQRYMSLGYSGGIPAIQMLVATNQRDAKDGAVKMLGRLHHGTSGGGVFDMDGALVGINVRTYTKQDAGDVMPLAETVLCNA